MQWRYRGWRALAAHTSKPRGSGGERGCWQRLHTFRDAKLMLLHWVLPQGHAPGGGAHRLGGPPGARAGAGTMDETKDGAEAGGMKGDSPNRAACMARESCCCSIEEPEKPPGRRLKPGNPNGRTKSAAYGFNVLHRWHTSLNGKFTLLQPCLGQTQHPGFILDAGGVFTASPASGCVVWQRLHCVRWGKLMLRQSSLGQRHDPTGGRNVVSINARESWADIGNKAKGPKADVGGGSGPRASWQRLHTILVG